MANSNKAEDFKEKAETEIEDLKTKYQEYKHTLVVYTQKNPISALAMAVGVGILIGKCLRAMHCKK
jgi:ElaB/YqjD/DUF883 family membrane-anchored ribosome-binding protein